MTQYNQSTLANHITANTAQEFPNILLTRAFIYRSTVTRRGPVLLEWAAISMIVNESWATEESVKAVK